MLLGRNVVVLESSIFWILSLLMLGGSIAMIVNKQTLFSAFGFLVVMVGLAGMFALLNNRFLALAQIMVSVGAVVVLSMLTILTINAKNKSLPKEENKYKWIVFSAVLVSPLTAFLYTTLSKTYTEFGGTMIVDSKVIGSLLFSKWVLPFEMVSILLLTAMIGAIVIARKKIPKQESE